MKIIVAGCGKIGSTLLSNLTAEGHKVTAVDSSASVITEVTNIYDVIGVCGNAADCETLASAGIEGAELFIACTNSDDLNMLSCFIAKKMGVPYTIARIRNPEYNDQSLGFMRRELELSMAINPELLAAEELFDILNLPSVVKVETFARRSFEMIELHLKEDSVLDGLMLKDLNEAYKTRVLICVVQRGENVYIPDGNFVLHSGDHIALTSSPPEIEKFLRSIGLLQKQARNVMLLGGGRTSYYLAKMLLESNSYKSRTVKIIERDEKVCQELSDALSGAVVIHGDGAQQELLMEEGLPGMDAFVTLTGMDEQNILMSIFASLQNVPKSITKINRSEMATLAEKLGLDTIISPKKIISDVLVQYARALENSRGSNVETLYKLMGGQAEALEFNVTQDPLLTDIPLRDLKLKENILIAGILRGRKAIVPGGNDCIMAGDKVIVLATKHRLQDLSDIIK